MIVSKIANPEESWGEMIKDFGDDHDFLTPRLASLFSEDPFSLMWAVSWFKFAGKMIGTKGKTLVFDPLEGLGGWTVACETKDVVTVLPAEDDYDAVRAAWPGKNITFEKGGEIVRSSQNEFAGIVHFELGAPSSIEWWGDFFEEAARILVPGGIVVAGGRGDLFQTVLKDAATERFKHIFMFGQGQIHPCVNPADAVILMAC